MTVYLGSLGRMIPIYSTPSAQLESEERFNFKRTIEGRRKAEIVPGGRRSWSLNAQFADPSASATLQEFADGSWGRGPFWFVSADASVTNLLTPAASSCDPAEVSLLSGAELLGSPPMTLGGDVWAARSVWKSTGNGAGIGGPVPVLPGSRVTASAWVVGAGRVRLTFLDSAGSQVSDADSPLGGSAPVRLNVSAMVPAGAVSARFYVTASVSQVARPAITWTDSLQPYGDGQGCAKAVVHGVSRDQVLAVPGHTFSNLSFTVTEVG